MASYTLGAGAHGAYEKQLAANTVDTVTFPEDLDRVEVVGDGIAALYFTVDGSTPTVAGDATLNLPIGAVAVREVGVPTAGKTIVKLISAGTPKYSVAAAR